MSVCVRTSAKRKQCEKRQGRTKFSERLLPTANCGEMAASDTKKAKIVKICEENEKLRVVAARSPLRCSPVWRAINYVFDAARMCEQLQRSFTLRAANAIANHGAEKVATAEKTTVEIFSRSLPLCLINFAFSFSRLNLNRVARKKIPQYC